MESVIETAWERGHFRHSRDHDDIVYYCSITNIIKVCSVKAKSLLDKPRQNAVESKCYGHVSFVGSKVTNVCTTQGHFFNHGIHHMDSCCTSSGSMILPFSISSLGDRFVAIRDLARSLPPNPVCPLSINWGLEMSFSTS